ncbi:MAG TPA: DMT family transporter [Anaerolineales bacterium]|nr:DMT family transporter [Anaerolineales bacterium]
MKFLGRSDNLRWAYLLVNLSTLLWASNITIGRALRGQIGPFTLVAFRFSIAGLVFGILLRRQPAEARRLGNGWRGLLGMGIFGVFAFPALLYLALQSTTATNAALINGTGPLVTAIMASVLLGEHFSSNRLIGTLISLLGVGLVISGPSTQILQGARINSGDLIVLADVFLWGLYSILGRVVMRARSALSATAYSIWFAIPFLLVAAALEWSRFPPHLTPTVLLAGIYIAIFPTCIAFLSWNEGIRRVGPSRAMTFYNMLPVYGAFLGFLFLGETPKGAHVAGGLLVIIGALTALSQFRLSTLVQNLDHWKFP